jgi:hypothetical protein
VVVWAKRRDSSAKCDAELKEIILRGQYGCNRVAQRVECRNKEIACTPPPTRRPTLAMKNRRLDVSQFASHASTFVVLAIFATSWCFPVTGQEPLPLQDDLETPTANDDAESESPCETIEDLPLSQLTVDARLRGLDGTLLDQDDQPMNCWTSRGSDGSVLFIGGSCGCCNDLSYQVLQLARFCHRPLLFEDVSLERYGVSDCCPPLHAATHFTCDLFLLPARAITTSGKCVRTPTPTLCTPYGHAIDYRIPAATWVP